MGGGLPARGVCCGGMPVLGEAGVETPPMTATAADDTHPTGMHSCLFENLVKSYVGAPSYGEFWIRPCLLQKISFIRIKPSSFRLQRMHRSRKYYRD